MRAGAPASVLALLALASAFAAFATPAGAQSGEALGVAPDRISVPDAQAGESYVRSVSLQHQYDEPATIRVEVDGPEGAWVKTDPASPFTMPARTNRAVAVTVAVPPNASPGAHETTLRFVRETADTPAGGGASVEVSAGIHLDVFVGGEPVERITYVSARVDDAEQGEPVLAYVLARNDGNVRATAQASGEVLPFAEDSPVLAEATGSLVLVPGEEAEVPLAFTAALEPAQYRARLSASGFNATLPFKVTPPGQAAPDGTLRAIVHVPRATEGKPVDIHLWFENTGDVAIAKAVAHLEVSHDGEVLARLLSAEVSLEPGQHTNLTVTWTPAEPGTYTLVGRVAYDAYETLPNEGLLNVLPAGAPFPWWFVVLVAAAAAAVVAAWAWRRRRDRLERERKAAGAAARPPRRRG